MENNIAFEATKDLEAWLKILTDLPGRPITAPRVPYSYYEIMRELTRRENMQAALEE